jgi:hypothetical protein
MIITGRGEQYRHYSEKWLKKWGMSVKKLIMKQDKDSRTIPEYKADEYRKSRLDIYVESCPVQAEEICKLSGKRVICPHAGRVYDSAS